MLRITNSKRELLIKLFETVLIFFYCFHFIFYHFINYTLSFSELFTNSNLVCIGHITLRTLILTLKSDSMRKRHTDGDGR